MKFNGLFAGFLTFVASTLLNFYMIPWVLDLVATSDITNEVLIISSYALIGTWFIFSNMLAPIMIAREDETL